MSANISLMGNLGRTPETRISDNGTLIATFPMASNSVRNTAEGQIKKTNWFRVTAFGKQAETLARYLRKGSRLCVQGRLTFSPWLNRNGEPQVSADVVLQEFQFVPGGRRDDRGEIGESAAIPPTEVQDVSGQSAAAH
ncbi:MAG: single-stranded DNA-binding protein [Pyrinomonadaceae bacterium]